MGFGLASNVLRAGLPLTVFDLRSEPVGALRALGAAAAGSPSEIAAASDVMAVCVVHEEQVLSVVTGEGGFLESARPGAVVVLHSTIHPDVCRKLEEHCRQHGVDLLDVGMSGYADKAASGDLTLMIGGSDEAAARCEPYFQAIGSQSFRIGPVGTGEVAKLANNVMAIFGILGTYEGLALARSYGIDEETMATVALAASGNSDALRRWKAGQRRPTTTPSGEPAPFPVGTEILGRALAVAREHGADLPYVAAVIEARQRQTPA
jgi:3-hydroxyisobutyrate dehydrogenase-like beta-hydroxyacid dehydrogenase